MLKFFAFLSAVASLAGKVADIITGRQRAREREQDREAGRNEQKVADHEGQQESVAKGKQAAHRVATDSSARDRVRAWATKSGDK